MAAEDGILAGGPHRRWDPLRGAWVLVSPGRTDRPWQGAAELPSTEERPPYDPACYLCPGNARANDERNPAYDGPFVFTNDFAALRPGASSASWEGGSGLLRATGEPGTCRVVCYSLRHDIGLGDLPASDVRRVVDVWATETERLGRSWRWVQVFENRGEAMGASNPHPHGQIWAGSALPEEAAREDANQRAWLMNAGGRLLGTLAAVEANGPRAVEASERWLAVVPFWAVWPFETLILPHGPAANAARLTDLDPAARDDLATFVGRLVRRYDRLFGVPFPYSMGWHGAPFGDDAATDAWTVHGHVYPPLLRSATVRKFMVGYELLAEPQRDVLPEDAAARLRAIEL